MVKSEYIIKNIVDNGYDPMLLELQSIGYGNTLFVELNYSTIADELQLRMIRTLFQTSDVSKVDIDTSDKLFSESVRHYLSAGDEPELHAVVEFNESDYTIRDIIAG